MNTGTNFDWHSKTGKKETLSCRVSPCPARTLHEPIFSFSIILDFVTVARVSFPRVHVFLPSDLELEELLVGLTVSCCDYFPLATDYNDEKNKSSSIQDLCKISFRWRLLIMRL